MQLPAGGPGGRTNGGNGVWIVPRLSAVAGVMEQIDKGEGGAYQVHRNVKWDSGLNFELPLGLYGQAAVLSDPVTGVSSTVVANSGFLSLDRETLAAYYQAGVPNVHVLVTNGRGMGLGIVIHFTSATHADLWLY